MVDEYGPNPKHKRWMLTKRDLDECTWWSNNGFAMIVWKKVLSWLMLISGDSWMYPYQRTPMGNPYYKPYISHANGMAEAYPVKDLQDGQKILWAWLWLQKSGDEKINALSGYLCRFDTWKIWYPIPLPMYPYGKPLGVFMGSYPQESLSTMGTLLGVHPIVPWLLGINKWLWH